MMARKRGTFFPLGLLSYYKVIPRDWRSSCHQRGHLLDSKVNLEESRAESWRETESQWLKVAAQQTSSAPGGGILLFMIKEILILNSKMSFLLNICKCPGYWVQSVLQVSERRLQAVASWPSPNLYLYL